MKRRKTKKKADNLRQRLDKVFEHIEELLSEETATIKAAERATQTATFRANMLQDIRAVLNHAVDPPKKGDA